MRVARKARKTFMTELVEMDLIWGEAHYIAQDREKTSNPTGDEKDKATLHLQSKLVAREEWEAVSILDKTSSFFFRVVVPHLEQSNKV